MYLAYPSAHHRPLLSTEACLWRSLVGRNLDLNNPVARRIRLVQDLAESTRRLPVPCGRHETARVRAVRRRYSLSQPMMAAMGGDWDDEIVELARQWGI